MQANSCKWKKMGEKKVVNGKCHFSVLVGSFDRSTPFCSAFPEKYSQTLHSIEAGIRTFASGGTWWRPRIALVKSMPAGMSSWSSGGWGMGRRPCTTRPFSPCYSKTGQERFSFLGLRCAEARGGLTPLLVLEFGV